MSTFKAFGVHNENGKINSRFEQMSIDQIGTGNVVIKAAYSNINYKDALAATGPSWAFITEKDTSNVSLYHFTLGISAF